MTEKKFIKGLWFNLPHEKAPAFVKGSISISKESFMEWLKAEQPNEKGYIKIDLKVSQENKPYADLNTYKAGSQTATPQAEAEITPDQVPF